MTTTFQVTFDCLDPERLAEFWMAALGYVKADPPEGFSTWEEWLTELGIPEDEWGEGAWIIDPGGRGPKIYFQGVPEPKSIKNRLHLDLDIADRPAPIRQRKEEVEAEAARLSSLGASRVQEYEIEGGHYHVVMQDPEGNEFCLR